MPAEEIPARRINFIRQMVSDIIGVQLLLLRVNLIIAMNDDSAQLLFVQDFCIYIRNPLFLNNRDIDRTLPSMALCVF